MADLWVQWAEVTGWCVIEPDKEANADGRITPMPQADIRWSMLKRRRSKAATEEIDHTSFPW